MLQILSLCPQGNKQPCLWFTKYSDYVGDIFLIRANKKVFWVKVTEPSRQEVWYMHLKQAPPQTLSLGQKEVFGSYYVLINRRGRVGRDFSFFLIPWSRLYLPSFWILQILSLRQQGNKQVECNHACSTQKYCDYLGDIFLIRANKKVFWVKVTEPSRQEVWYMHVNQAPPQTLSLGQKKCLVPIMS